MTFKLNKSLMMMSLAIATAFPAMQANAGATISFGEDKSITAGFGFITSYLSQEDGAANGNDRSNDFALNSARIYLSGSLNKYIKGMFNTERSGDTDLNGSGATIEVIDANVQLQITPEVAIWAGRFLPPSDRANMAGPYYSSGGGGGYWANISSRYGWNGGVIGRDEGVAVVTSFLEDKVAVSFGAFEGDNIFRFSGAGALSETKGDKDKLMYAGRVQVALWDAEPGYYGTGNYFGAKDILTVGISGKQKTDGAVSAPGVAGDYTNVSVDFLMEKKNVGPGTLSLEAAYYDYDTDDVITAEQGDAYYAGAGYLLNQQIGWGKFMPFARYQAFDADNKVKTDRVDVGVNYVMAPYNAIISAEYQNTGLSGSGVTAGAKKNTDAILISMQYQF